MINCLNIAWQSVVEYFYPRKVIMNNLESSNIKFKILIVIWLKSLV